MKQYPLSFPRDESQHKSVIEWWYFNGNLRSEDGREFAFMYCLFKADAKKVKLPLFEKVPVKELYFVHGLVSDIKNRKFYPMTDFFYEGVSEKSFSGDFLAVESPGHSFWLKENKLFDYDLASDNLALHFTSNKKPLLVNESGYIDLKTKDTFYYSLSDLKTVGKIKINRDEIPVTGKSWMDHQWADNPYSPEDKWVWFSIQLASGLELVCFDYGDKHKTRHATVSYPDGSQKSTNNAVFTPLGRKWISPRTGAAYNTHWQIELPDLGIKLATRAKLDEQEVLFAAINYWEGGVKVEAEVGGGKIVGEGFSEMVGIPMGGSKAKFYLTEARRLASSYIDRYMARP